MPPSIFRFVSFNVSKWGTLKYLEPSIKTEFNQYTANLVLFEVCVRTSVDFLLDMYMKMSEM